MTLPPEHIFSVSEFLDVIHALVSAQKFMIQGEISSISQRGSNIFFTIADKNDGSLLDCYVHDSKVRNLGTQMKVGLEIKIYGTPGIYKRNGKFNLTVANINLVGEGALKQAYEQLKRELDGEGYFDPVRKRAIPEYPTRIGLITSAAAAAKKDFLQNLTRKGIKIFFRDTRVEGLRSEDDVAEAIREMNQSGVPMDLIVLTRGGGSWESLQAFNHKTVALAVASSRIPIISAIGHEQDVLISDLVADLRASTPTHAAKLLSEHWNTALTAVETYEESIISNVKNSIRHYEKIVEGTRLQVTGSFGRAITKNVEKVEVNQAQLVGQLNKVLTKTKELEERFQINASIFSKLLGYRKEGFEKQVSNLESGYVRWIASLERRFKYIEEQVDNNDPTQRLKQGYSIIMNKEGKVVRDIEEFEIDEVLNVKLYKGSVDTKVIKKIN